MGLLTNASSSRAQLGAALEALRLLVEPVDLANGGWLLCYAVLCISCDAVCRDAAGIDVGRGAMPGGSWGTAHQRLQGACADAALWKLGRESR